MRGSFPDDFLTLRLPFLPVLLEFFSQLSTILLEMDSTLSPDYLLVLGFSGIPMHIP
jgi:hypothetical protein